MLPLDRSLDSTYHRKSTGSFFAIWAGFLPSCPADSLSHISCTHQFLFVFFVRLDYCNSLFFGISDGPMSRLQSVQNAATRLVTGTWRCDHIMPLFRLLNWLPVHQRISFKVATLVHRSLSGNSASYLADDCRLVADTRERRLRSTESRTCVVTRTHNTFVDRALQLPVPGY